MPKGLAILLSGMKPGKEKMDDMKSPKSEEASKADPGEEDESKEEVAEAMSLAGLDSGKVDAFLDLFELAKRHCEKFEGEY